MKKLKYAQANINHVGCYEIRIYNDEVDDYLFAFDMYYISDEQRRLEVLTFVLVDKLGLYPDDISHVAHKHPQLAQLLIKHADMLSPCWGRKSMFGSNIFIEYEYFVRNILSDMEPISILRKES